MFAAPVCSRSYDLVTDGRGGTFVSPGQAMSPRLEESGL